MLATVEDKAVIQKGPFAVIEELSRELLLDNWLNLFILP